MSPGPQRHDELRRSLTDWLRANLTPEVVAAGQAGMVSTETVEILRAWNRVLADAGWAAISWPAEYGGRDASVAEQLAFHEVMTAFKAPGPVNVIGVANIAPAIMAVGTSEQKDRYLAPMLRGDEIWCQGMSEPDCRLGPGLPADHGRWLTAKSSSSTARRPGTAWASMPTGASSTSAPTPRLPSTRGSAACWSTCDPPASRPGRCAP